MTFGRTVQADATYRERTCNIPAAPSVYCIGKQRNDRFLKLVEELRRAAGKSVDNELRKRGKTQGF